MAGNKNSGRKAYRPTQEGREKVRVLKAGGMTDSAIAVAMGISAPSLSKHFSEELAKGSAIVRSELLMARYRAALGGNVSAQAKMLDDVVAASAGEKMKEREQQVKAPRIGKKEERRLAAESVDGKFAPPAGPKLVVNNR
ncbi:hypothetical protein LUX29_18140 [Aureimonas altamirensis]|uniref:hypothetical protein n=1 Tax=Aureimonas altamirensis TaxID=370622 RepID=UPI001E5E1F93|nr:hypothetical protein [Aureimonas altamirensis]UHD44924.1 hypothetical protein LUX29_18140 [Aureimonas altamirensis]